MAIAGIRPEVTHWSKASPQDRELVEVVAACVESFEKGIGVDFKERSEGFYKQYRGFRAFKDAWVQAGPNCTPERGNERGVCAMRFPTILAAAVLVLVAAPVQAHSEMPLGLYVVLAPLVAVESAYEHTLDAVDVARRETRRAVEGVRGAMRATFGEGPDVSRSCRGHRGCPPFTQRFKGWFKRRA